MKYAPLNSLVGFPARNPGPDWIGTAVSATRMRRRRRAAPIEEFPAVSGPHRGIFHRRMKAAIGRPEPLGRAGRKSRGLPDSFDW